MTAFLLPSLKESKRMEKIDIVSLNFEELCVAFAEIGLPKFRATQVYDWLHKKCVASFEEMTNISKDLIAKLNDNFVIFSCIYLNLIVF